MPDINPFSVDNKIKLFRGVQKYLIGAVIVGQCIAITSMATYIVKLHKDSGAEMRQFLEYFMKKNEGLEQDLQSTKQTNQELAEKTEEAIRLLQGKKKQFKPKI